MEKKKIPINQYRCARYEHPAVGGSRPVVPAPFAVGRSPTAWAGANIVFVLLGLILSVVCVRSREIRSIINIISTAISVFWLLLMVGIVVLALFLTFVQ